MLYITRAEDSEYTTSLRYSGTQSTHTLSVWTPDLASRWAAVRVPSSFSMADLPRIKRPHNHFDVPHNLSMQVLVRPRLIECMNHL